MTPILNGVSSTMRINFCTEGTSCGVADMVSLQSQGKTRNDFGKQTERVGIGKIADVSEKGVDFGWGQNLAEHRPGFEKEIRGIAVVGFKKFFEMGEWLDDSGGVGVWGGGAGGSRLRG